MHTNDIIGLILLGGLIIAGLIDFYLARKKSTREETILKTCGCVCYCPQCKEPLNDQADCTDEEFVTYTCSVCGTVSKWNFDIAPVPILMKDL